MNLGIIEFELISLVYYRDATLLQPGEKLSELAQQHLLVK
jgi:hypothetical protein